MMLRAANYGCKQNTWQCGLQPVNELFMKDCVRVRKPRLSLCFVVTEYTLACELQQNRLSDALRSSQGILYPSALLAIVCGYLDHFCEFLYQRCVQDKNYLAQLDLQVVSDLITFVFCGFQCDSAHSFFSFHAVGKENPASCDFRM